MVSLSDDKQTDNIDAFNTTSRYLDDILSINYNLVSMRENLSSGICEQRRRRPACASALSDQRLFIRFLERSIPKLATGEISIF